MDKNSKNIVAIKDFMGKEEGICKVNVIVYRKGYNDIVFQGINLTVTNSTYTTGQFCVGINWEEDKKPPKKLC